MTFRRSHRAPFVPIPRPGGTRRRWSTASICGNGCRRRSPAYWRRGRDGDLAETPKPGDEAFARVRHRVVANLQTAVQAATARAESLGIRARTCDLAVTGQAEAAAERLVRAGRDELDRARGPFCLVYGGETVVRVRGQGRGGRCQQLALRAAAALAGEPRLTLLAAGTDGTDGPTDAAGAVVDGGTIGRGAKAGLDASRHLMDNDAYSYLRASGDLIITGPTHTNVNDLLLVLGGTLSEQDQAPIISPQLVGGRLRWYPVTGEAIVVAGRFDWIALVRLVILAAAAALAFLALEWQTGVYENAAHNSEAILAGQGAGPNGAGPGLRAPCRRSPPRSDRRPQRPRPVLRLRGRTGRARRLSTWCSRARRWTRLPPATR